MKVINGHWEAESKEDFHLWNVMGIRDYKKGVKQVYIRSKIKPPFELRIVDCKDEFLPVEKVSEDVSKVNPNP